MVRLPPGVGPRSKVDPEKTLPGKMDFDSQPAPKDKFISLDIVKKKSASRGVFSIVRVEATPKDGDGKVILHASKEAGGAGPCVVLDAKDNNAYIGAGDAQIHLKGNDGKIFVTKQMIVEAEPIDLESFIEATKDALKNYFLKYDNNSGQGDA
jgi:hypothetical protein